MNAENSLVLFSELHAKFTQNDTKNFNTKKSIFMPLPLCNILKLSQFLLLFMTARKRS